MVPETGTMFSYIGLLTLARIRCGRMWRSIERGADEVPTEADSEPSREHDQASTKNRRVMMNRSLIKGHLIAAAPSTPADPCWTLSRRGGHGRWRAVIDETHAAQPAAIDCRRSRVGCKGATGVISALQEMVRPEYIELRRHLSWWFIVVLLRFPTGHLVYQVDRSDSCKFRCASTKG